ncbi:hypothetical protein DRN67_04565 [Candidatus Micrarchaeota archaeon]|nr:MAG: hypothetical protein DRN67_04565 [Candidatus Micrarchaeota archaeon]
MLCSFFSWLGFNERRAQISVELIIVLAAVVALVLLLVSQLQETSSEGAKVIEKKSKEIFEEIEKI